MSVIVVCVVVDRVENDVKLSVVVVTVVNVVSVSVVVVVVVVSIPLVVVVRYLVLVFVTVLVFGPIFVCISFFIFFRFLVGCLFVYRLIAVPVVVYVDTKSACVSEVRGMDLLTHLGLESAFLSGTTTSHARKLPTQSVSVCSIGGREYKSSTRSRNEFIRDL